jgi:hypothetical protein
MNSQEMGFTMIVATDQVTKMDLYTVFKIPQCKFYTSNHYILAKIKTLWT